VVKKDAVEGIDAIGLAAFHGNSQALTIKTIPEEFVKG
jgi:hypothetical protein